MRRRFIRSLALFLFVLAPTAFAAALGNEFTYQGRLQDGAGPATASYDMQFKLFDSLANPTGQVGSTVPKPGVAVTGGLFTVSLDFGASAFDGNGRWLEIAVSPAGMATYTTLAPRQALTATPYALYSKAPAAPSGSNYLYAYDTTTQATAGPFQRVTFNTLALANGWTYISAGGPTMGTFTASTTGLYSVTYAVQTDGASSNDVILRLVKNLVEVPASRVVMALAVDSPHQAFLQRTVLIQVSAGDTMGVEVSLNGQLSVANSVPSASIVIQRLQ
jgi:hypothetical protein